MTTPNARPRRHLSFGANAADLEHVRTVAGIRDQLALICAQLNDRIDDEASKTAVPGEWPASHWAMTEVLALLERTRQLALETELPLGLAWPPIPPMRWAPWGRIVVRREDKALTGWAIDAPWYDPTEYYSDNGSRHWSDDEVADWPCLGRVLNPITKEN